MVAVDVVAVAESPSDAAATPDPAHAVVAVAEKTDGPQAATANWSPAI